MDAQLWVIIGQIATVAIVPLLGTLGVWASMQIKRWQAKTDLKTMKENAMDAVQAIEQLYPDETGENKKKLALEWARHLNTVAGVTSQDKTQLILNEASVLSLPFMSVSAKSENITSSNNAPSSVGGG